MRVNLRRLIRGQGDERVATLEGIESLSTEDIDDVFKMLPRVIGDTQRFGRRGLLSLPSRPDCSLDLEVIVDGWRDV